MAMPQSQSRDSGREAAQEPVLFCLWRAINDVESLFQLFEQSRDFFGRMLQIVIHRHDHIVFCRANAAEQRIMLAIIAHQIQSAHRREREDSSEIISQLRSRLSSLTRMISYSRRDPRQHFAQTPAQFSYGSLAIVNWRDYGNGTPLGRLQR